MGILTAVIAVPLIASVGMSIEYSLALNEKRLLQSNLDVALLAATAKIDKSDIGSLKRYVGYWISSATGSNIYNVRLDKFDVDKEKKTISATVRGETGTSFLLMLGVKHLTISASSETIGPSTSNIEVHIVIDKSPSMLLAANAVEQKKLIDDKKIQCQFACHSPDHTVEYNGKYVQMYDYIKLVHGSRLRADVVVDAVDKLLDLTEKSNAKGNHVKIALYRLGETATQVLKPTYSTTEARRTLNDDEAQLSSDSSERATYFDLSLQELEKIVGTGGDGTTPEKAKKLVILLTDGVQSEREWMLAYYEEPLYKVLGWGGIGNSAYSREYIKLVGPLNPEWCSAIKENEVTFAVLYTEYTEAENDQGYKLSLKKSMREGLWSKTWGGNIRHGVSDLISRRDYISYALEDCASPNLFLAAEDEAGIEKGLSYLLTSYLNSSLRISK